MRLSSTLDGADIERPRTLADFVVWVGRKVAELNATPEIQASARARDGLAKKFYDEILPLKLFVAREYAGRNDVLIQPHLGNENFDARVTVGGGGTAQDLFVEITYAKDGYDDSLRMEALVRDGSVCLTGPVEVVGRKGSPDRYVSVESGAANHLETVGKQYALVEKRLRDKADKKYGDNHVLVVAVDDYFALMDNSDWPQFEAHASAVLSTLALDFPRVVFVGMAGRLFISIPLTGASARPRQQMGR